MCILVNTSTLSLAQKTSNDDYTGDWDDDNSWTGGTAPATANIGNADLDLNIYGYLSRINGDQNLSFANVNADATGPDFVIHDTLVVYGNLSFANKAANLIIQSGAVLIVLGDFSATNFINVANGGIFVVAGAMSFSNSPNDDYAGTGELYAGSVSGNANASSADQGLLQLETDHPEIYDFIISGGIYPLPVEILYFKVSEYQGSVKLEWATSYEERLDFFTLERSPDGIVFRDYARIEEAISVVNSIKIYKFSDEMPLGGTSYYRLKATDLDGNMDYHGVLAVRMEGIPMKILISPNPLTGHTMNASYTGSSDQTYKILNTAGMIVGAGIMFPGMNVIELNPALHPGLYIMQIEYSGITKSKFIIE